MIPYNEAFHIRDISPRLRVEFFRRHWKWIAKNPTKTKLEFPEWWHNGGTVIVNAAICILCSDGDCCLINWSTSNKRSCLGISSPYVKYCTAMLEDDYEEVTKRALEISELPINLELLIEKEKKVEESTRRKERV